MPINSYLPDYAVHPGVTLEEALAERGMTQAQLALRMGRSPKEINEIVHGKIGITADTALVLERVLGIPAGFWIRLNANFREFEARQKAISNNTSHQKWLEQFDVAELIRRRWISNVQGIPAQAEALFQYFGVASPGQLDVLWRNKCHALRKSPTLAHDHWALITWLRRGEILAQKLECEEFNENKVRAMLKQARTLTQERDPSKFWPKLEDLCAKAGIALVMVQELPKTRTSGATQWLSSTKALLQLSLRYKTNDQLWFTFFHECGHILLHGKKDLFVEDGTIKDKNAEDEANDFATNALIPRGEWNRYLEAEDFSSKSVQQFADGQGVSAGIVVGQLQHNKLIGWHQLNGFKTRYAWES